MPFSICRGFESHLRLNLERNVLTIHRVLEIFPVVALFFTHYNHLFTQPHFLFAGRA